MPVHDLELRGRHGATECQKDSFVRWEIVGHGLRLDHHGEGCVSVSLHEHPRDADITTLVASGAELLVDITLLIPTTGPRGPLLGLIRVSPEAVLARHVASTVVLGPSASKGHP